MPVAHQQRSSSSPPGVTATTRKKKKSHGNSDAKKSLGKTVKRQQDAKLLAELEQRTATPFDASKVTFFTELPLSDRTKRGLQALGFVEMTDIQKASLGYTLCGRDVLGAAKTGSGKTLAFVIPALEKLYRQNWTSMDGLGALIISPTRELAMQTFQVLRKVGKHHGLSAGLVIGGKDVKFERDRIGRMNILVATPGRLLQHMDEAPDFSAYNLHMLILDEADRCLDLGFKKTLNAILEHLPTGRQTLLFSATQTKSVRDLARLSLKDPEYVSVHEEAEKSTPDSLQQNYLVCELQQKLDILFSFIRSHLQAKVLVFLSSCKQVRFVHESFCKLQPGAVLMCLHGKQKQAKRMIMFEKFCRSKAAVLFCTDIAARGLDFPTVDWVIQIDCPEDVETYIHRVGRTARYKADGKALLMLTPSEEEGMVKLFEQKRVPVEKIAVNPSKTKTVSPNLRSICAQSPEIKYLGEKAFICYLRSVWLNKNKEVFDIAKLPLDEFASSLGLPGAPQVKFVRKLNDAKNQSRARARKQELQQRESADESKGHAVAGEDSDSSEASDMAAAAAHEQSTRHVKIDRMFNKKNQSVLSQHYQKIKSHDVPQDDEDGDNYEDDGLLTMKRRDHDLDDIPVSAPSLSDRPASVRDKRNQKLKNRIRRDNIGQGARVVFDEGGVAHPVWQLETEKDFMADGDDVFTKSQQYVNTMNQVMKEADQEDKVIQKQKLREKRQQLKAKLKGRQRDQGHDDVTLGGGDDDDDDGDDAYSSDHDNFSDPNFRSNDEYDMSKKDGANPRKRAATANGGEAKRSRTMDDDEALALRLLNDTWPIEQ